MREKKPLALLLTLALLLACLPGRALAGTDAALTGRGAEDIVSVALTRLGRTGEELGYSFEWCACFVSWAGRAAGQDFPQKDLYTPLDLAKYFVEADKGDFYCFRQETYDSLRPTASPSAVLTTRAEVTPKKGDLVCFLWAKDIEEGFNWSHIGILTRDYDGSGVLHTIEGNTGEGEDPQSRRVCLQTRAYDATVVGIIRPDYTGRGRTVNHYLEQYGGGYALADTETVAPAGETFTLDDALRAIRTYEGYACPDPVQFVPALQAEGPLDLYYPRYYTLAVITGDGVARVVGSGQYTAGTEVAVQVSAAAGTRLIWTDGIVRQKDGQWTLTMPASDVLLGVSAKKIDCVEPFLDVEAAAWYASYVRQAHELGLMNGTAPDAFAPERGMTLAEAVTLAARLHSIAAGDGADFTPLDGEPWYAPYAAYARENGLLPENEAPDLLAAATRLEFTRILGRALDSEDLEPLGEPPAFADLEEDLPPEVELLCRAGVLTGETVDGTVYFRPGRSISRAEAAAVIVRMAEPGMRLRPAEA